MIYLQLLKIKQQGNRGIYTKYVEYTTTFFVYILLIKASDNNGDILSTSIKFLMSHY